MIEQFSIGYVPEGWTRGEKLHVTIVPGGFGTITKDILAAPCPSRAGSVSRTDAVLTFHAAELSRVETWLEWWTGSAGWQSCPRCGGQGFIEISGAIDFQRDATCTYCGGSGEVYCGEPLHA